MERRVIIIIPADKLVEGNQLASQVDLNHNPEMFLGKLSPTGELPITHYYLASSWTKEEYERLVQVFGLHNEWADVFDLELYTHNQVLDTLGLKRVLEESKPVVGTWTRVKKWFEINILR